MQEHLRRLSGAAEASLKYWIASLLIAIPLFPKFPFLDVPGTQVSVRLEDFLIAIVLLVWFVSVLPSLRTIWSRRPINKAIFIFVFVGFVSVVSGVFLTQTVVAHIGLLHWARRVEYLSCFFIGASGIRKKEDLAFYAKVVMLVIGFAFVFGVGQKYFNWPVITTQNSEYAKGIALRYRDGSHLISTFAGHYDLATYAILVTPLLWALALDKGKALRELAISRNLIVSRVVVGLVAIAAMWLLVNAASRISIVSYLGSVTLALLILRRYRYILFVVVFSLAFTLTSSNLMDRYMNIIDVSIRRLVAEISINVHAQESGLEMLPVLEDRSTSIRLNVEWPRAVRAFYKNPLLGTGYSSITLATDNGYLRMLGEVGAFGFLAFLLILLRIIERLVRVIPKVKDADLSDVYIASMLAAMPGVLLNMMFIDVLEASKFATMFWLLIGIAIAAVYKKKYVKEA